MSDNEIEFDGQNTAGDETAAVDNAADETNVEKTESDEVDQEDPGDATKDDDGIDKEMKTIKKALNKKNRYIDNQRSKIRALEAEMQKLRSMSVENKKQAPQMEQFESVLDYVRADSAHSMEQKFAEQQQQQQLSALEQQQAALRAQQDQMLAGSISDMVSAYPEAKAALTSNLTVIQAMPKHVEDLLYEIDDAPSAVYALSKEGRLQDIYHMNPNVAAAELVQAQHRGQQYLSKPAAPQKQPPKPLDGLKGRGKGSRSVGDLSPDEIVKRYIR